MQVNFKGGIYLSPKANQIRSFYIQNFNADKNDGLSELSDSIKNKDTNFVIDQYLYNPEEKTCKCSGVINNDGSFYYAFYNNDAGEVVCKDKYKKV